LYALAGFKLSCVSFVSVSFTIVYDTMNGNDQYMRLRLLTAWILPAAGIAAVLILGSAGYGTGVKADDCTTNPIVTTNADSGAGSLRQAIADACPGSTITFAKTVVSPITLASELSIDENLTIQGPGASSLTISGNNSVSGLTLSNGKAPVVGGQAVGGCIFNNSTSTLTITSVTVSNSTAQGVFAMGGGGILNNNTGTLDITNSTISGNSSSDGFGGGILNNAGTVNITNSNIVGNSAGDGTGGAFDGAGTLNVTGSTILLIPPDWAAVFVFWSRVPRMLSTAPSWTILPSS
jgi:hypothetical protein